MPKKARKFIDKKNSITFQLVHRSQKDPLITDERAPQRVLVPVYEEQTENCAESSTCEQRKKEQQKYGIFFDDEYNYLQHLRDVNKLTTDWESFDNSSSFNTKINLPSSVFESSIEEKTGILNKASELSGFRVDLDPDIVAALDDDFDFDNPDNELEDNFIELADAEINKSALNENYENGSDSNGECDDVMSLSSEISFKNEETKSHFTKYSMSSSIIKRNKQLTLLDDKFEKMFASYDENAIGALDNEEIEGFIRSDSDVLLQCVNEHENEPNEIDNLATLIKEGMEFKSNHYDFDEDENHTTLENIVVNSREKIKFDCQSILSTYSNLYNHPRLIIEPRVISKINVNSKNGIPNNILNERKNTTLTMRNLAQYDMENESIKSKMFTKHTTAIRKKNETAEQKKERKQAIKNYRKERRMERKFNIKTFKEEKKRQEKILINEKNNIQGNRIS